MELVNRGASGLAWLALVVRGRAGKQSRPAGEQRLGGGDLQVRGGQSTGAEGPVVRG